MSKELNLKEGTIYGYKQDGIKQLVIYDCLTEHPITVSEPSGQYHRFLLPWKTTPDGKNLCEVIELTDQEAYELIYISPTSTHFTNEAHVRWYPKEQSHKKK